MRETELSDFITALERQLSDQKEDMSKITIELQSTKNDVISLEQIIDEMSRKGEDKDLLGNVELSSESMKNRFQEMEGIAMELTRRAESAERCLLTVLATEPATLDATLIPNLFREASSFEMARIPATGATRLSMVPRPVPVDMDFIRCLKDSTERGHQNYSDYSYESRGDDLHMGVSPHFEQYVVPINDRSVGGRIVHGPPQHKTSSKVRKKVNQASSSPRAANRIARNRASDVAVSEVHNARHRVDVNKPRCLSPSMRVARTQNISQRSDCINQASEAVIRRKANLNIARTRPRTPSEKSRAVKDCSRSQPSSRSVPLIGRDPKNGGALATTAVKASLPKGRIHRENNTGVRYDSHRETGWSSGIRTTGNTESGRARRRTLAKMGKKVTEVPILHGNDLSTLIERTRRRSIQVRHCCSLCNVWMLLH